jgi:anti-sigma regulatory factor (Ser/Thr protein kinase)
LSGLKIPAETSHLRDAMTWLDVQCAAYGIGSDNATRLAIVVEEVILNVATYGGAPPRWLEFTFIREPLALELVIEDDGVAFDPTKAAAPDLTGDIDERETGGLGVHLVMKLMDEVAYSRDGGHNRLVLRKFLTAN